jgi:ABC-2 type transport system permease protein
MLVSVALSQGVAGRFLPFLANGRLVSVYAFGVGIVLLGVRLELSSIGVVALALVVTVFSCTAIGALQGSISLRLRDGLFGANLLVLAFLLFCGVNIPLSELPAWMQVVGNVLPFTHGLQAVRQAADGAGLGQVGGLILVELLIGVIYAVLAFVLFRVLERSSRRNATLDVR